MDYLIIQRQDDYYVIGCVPTSLRRPPKTLQGQEALTSFLQDVLQLSHEVIEKAVHDERECIPLSPEQVNRWPL